jgi:hypothetical protein
MGLAPEKLTAPYAFQIRQAPWFQHYVDARHGRRIRNFRRIPVAGAGSTLPRQG